MSTQWGYACLDCPGEQNILGYLFRGNGSGQVAARCLWAIAEPLAHVVQHSHNVSNVITVSLSFVTFNSLGQDEPNLPDFLAVHYEHNVILVNEYLSEVEAVNRETVRRTVCPHLRSLTGDSVMQSMFLSALKERVAYDNNNVILCAKCKSRFRFRE
jgi:hypothetical protein